ncbi:MAG: protein-L-isoaspartate(D-aspartate) O-methyltransferase [Candidatus Omnitrophica bacterium]|nr:protein-L-isoaspartate(D-aspartate) O-methyltransferase [Candidatus Omnitrophota bacterium]MDD5610354.1 protein-L-isoaspartate(D-aspartate) O-methyltransferase [Candidatus Omnitrophota bacterium]
MDYETLRERMVAEQLAGRDITDEKVLDVFKKIPRHLFVPAAFEKNAYADYPLPIGEEQTISQPYIVALMTQLLRLTGKEKVLEIGTGSGYQTAALAELAREVYSIERFEDLAVNAKNILAKLGYTNIKIKTGDGTLGWAEQAPFDRIIVTAAAGAIPKTLLEQLKDPGLLVIPLGETFSQVLTVAHKSNNKIDLERICGCVFVPLVGKHA